MKLDNITIQNYRSFIDSGIIKIQEFQSFLGENNSGKSNVLSSIEVLCSAGAGGVKPDSFNDEEKTIVIKGEFILKSASLKKIWKPYLINDRLILEKHLWIEEDKKTKKQQIKNEYHGYKAEPKDWFLSIDKIKEQKGNRPDWKSISKENNLPDYFVEDNKCTSAIYKKALDKYLAENDVEYDEPDVSSTQALGLQSNVIANLPQYYLLKAITDYSDEIDKRTSNTTFRKLMSDLSERIIKHDPKYKKIETALDTIHNLLNEEKKENEEIEDDSRIGALELIEEKLQETVKKLIPSVDKINLKVLTEDVKTIFSRGVELSIDDGVNTDVLMKGHGLQRCIVFSLLQALILNERNKLIEIENEEEVDIPIILAIEEPELYIHPQLGKLFFDVLKEFSEDNQVIYTTHSPRFIDVYDYENIAVVRKTKQDGSKVKNCDSTQFDGLVDKKIYKGIAQLNSDVNELFFAKKVIVVEGPEDKIAVTETCKKLGKIKNRVEELEITTIATNGTGNIPFFIRVLNAFSINYVVLHDLDLKPGLANDAKETIEKRNQNIADLIRDNKLVTFPIKLENTVGTNTHFKDQFYTLKFFSDHNNINVDLENIIKEVLTKLE